MKPIAILVGAAILLSCAPEPAPVHPVVGVDAAAGADVCAQACAKRKANGCLEPRVEADCVDVCHRAKADGLYDPACVVAAQTVEAMVRDCRVRCHKP